MRFRLKLDMKTFVFNNFWLKIISLGLAVAIWFYVNGELTKGIKI